MSLYYFAGGLARDFFGLSFPVSFIVSALGILCGYIVCPEKDAVAGEVLQFVVLIPFSIVPMGLMVWTVVALFL